MDYEKKIDIPFGAHDSELKGWEYTIPEGMEAIIKDGKVIVREKESEEERIRKELINFILYKAKGVSEEQEHSWVVYLEKQKEQNPAEWSKEDREMLTRCVAAIPVQGDEIMPTSYLNKLRNWLESLSKRLNLQSKREWNEENKKDIDYIIQILDDCYAFGKHDLSKKDHENLVNKLINLRPSWKPSKEHLSALLAIFNDPDNIGSQTCQLALTDLYEQIKSIQ